jgi:FHA domain
LIALQVEYLTGPNAGRKLLLRETCITFGRSAERTLPIDLPFISRKHGEFRYENGLWLLANLSNNSTILNGKPVTTKPRPIKGPCTIRIGDQDIFHVEPHAEGATEADPTQAPSDESSDSDTTTTKQTSGKVKLWAGIGVFWLAALGLIAFAALNPSDGSSSSPADRLPPKLTAEDIREHVTAEPDRSPPDDRRAAQELARAHELYVLIDRRPDALFGAYDAYRQALSYTRGDTFDNPQDQRRFHVLQQRLIEGATRRYDSANHLLKSRQFDQADKAFKDLRAFYPDPASPLFTDALKREAAARDALKKKRSR